MDIDLGLPYKADNDNDDKSNPLSINETEIRILGSDVVINVTKENSKKLTKWLQKKKDSDIVIRLSHKSGIGWSMSISGKKKKDLLDITNHEWW